MLKRTALFEEHKRLGGRLIDFGGWELPVQYTGVMDEHLACRSTAGIFDVSHMGEFHVEGRDSEAFLNYLVTNDVSKLAINQAQYTAMCYDTGGIVDDLIIYRRANDRFLVVVNASNTDKDFAWTLQVLDRFMTQHPDAKIIATNESSRYTQIAVQGRRALEILQPLTRVPLHTIKTYWFKEGPVLTNISATLARTGYTGEDGFEVYVPWERGPEVWRALFETGKAHGLKPCGLGARDTLRLEMKYPLYGHELSDQTNPLEAGLGWVVKLDKGDFVGRELTLALKEKGLPQNLVGIKLLERGIPRQGYAIYTADGTSKIGAVTSGTQSPSLKEAIAIAYVTPSHAAVGTRITVDIRGTKVLAEIVPTPFYKRPY
jgi:aminomethyltransferase